MQRESQEVIQCSERSDVMENEEAVAVNNLCHLNSCQCNGRIRHRPRGVKSWGAARKERGQRQGACPPSLVVGIRREEGRCHFRGWEVLEGWRI